MRISNNAAKAMLDALVDRLDTGSGTAVIRIYTGSAPTNVEDAASGTLLAELALSSTAFGSAADANPGAIATAAAISDDTAANNTGTAGYFRALDKDGTAVIQGSAGTSGTDLILDDAALVAGQTVKITSWTITLPET